jgi:hypothetical protein
MKIEGTHTFAAPRDKVWPLLLNPEVLASVLPGCQQLEMVAENQFKGVLKIRVGPVQGTFDGVVTLSNISPPQSYSLEISGKGAPGYVNGTGSLELAAENGTTVMQYKGTAQVGGRLASVGQRLLDSSARAIVRQSLEGLDRQVQAHTQPVTAGSDDESQASPAAEPTQTQFAAGVAKHMLEELIPEEQRREFLNKLVAGAAMFLAIFLVDNWRMNRLAKKVVRRTQTEGR